MSYTAAKIKSNEGKEFELTLDSAKLMVNMQSKFEELNGEAWESKVCCSLCSFFLNPILHTSDSLYLINKSTTKTPLVTTTTTTTTTNERI